MIFAQLIYCLYPLSNTIFPFSLVFFYSWYLVLQFKIVTFLPCHFYSVFTFRKQLTSNSQTPFLLYKLLSEVHPCIAPRHVLSSSLLAAIGHNSGLGCTPYPSNTSVVKWHSHLTQMQQPMWKNPFLLGSLHIFSLSHPESLLTLIISLS